MSFLGIILVAVVLVLFYKKRDVDEHLLGLKLIGYYILGIFYFNVNGFVIPLGFIISLFLKPEENKSIKRGASLFGLVIMIVGYIFNI
jgi:hypothetical protein